MSGIRKSKLWPEFEVLAAAETDECVLWPHGGGSNGYGQVQKFGVKVYTHREALLRRQPDPSAGLEAAHSCSNRGCMNYRHLRWATVSENQLDRIADGTHNRGERHGMNRYSEAAIRAAKADLAAGATARAVSERHGISRSTAAAVRQGKAWAWLA